MITQKQIELGSNLILNDIKGLANKYKVSATLVISPSFLAALVMSGMPVSTMKKALKDKFEEYKKNQK